MKLKTFKSFFFRRKCTPHTAHEMWKCKYTMFIENISQNYFGLFRKCFRLFSSFPFFVHHHARIFCIEERKEKRKTWNMLSHTLNRRPSERPLASLVLRKRCENIFYVLLFFLPRTPNSSLTYARSLTR